MARIARAHRLGQGQAALRVVIKRDQWPFRVGRHRVHRLDVISDAAPSPRQEQRTLAFTRLVTFTDAVFAIAATLLFVDLLPPQTGSDVYEAALLDYLSRPGPFLATTIGFLVVASYWTSHRRIFLLLEDASPGVIRMNLALLFGVALQPFLTAALAEHDPNRTSVTLYSVGQLGTSLAQLGLWAAALRSRRLTEAATARRVRFVTLQLLRSPVVFAASIPVTLLVGPGAGMLSWLTLVVLNYAVNTAYRDVANPRPPVQDRPPRREPDHAPVSLQGVSSSDAS